MADGFTDLTVDKLAEVEGVTELNRMLRFLFDNVPGDGLYQRIFSGRGTPEGSIVADIGSMYLNLTGGAATSVYMKETGVKTATGWVAGGLTGATGATGPTGPAASTADQLGLIIVANLLLEHGDS